MNKINSGFVLCAISVIFMIAGRILIDRGIDQKLKEMN